MTKEKQVLFKKLGYKLIHNLISEKSIFIRWVYSLAGYLVKRELNKAMDYIKHYDEATIKELKEGLQSE